MAYFSSLNMYKNNLPVYDEKRCTLFALGRNAMYAACQVLKLKPNDEVLTPAFDCDSSLQPFRVLGIKLHFFCSNPYNFFADIDDIRKKINSRTRLIHIINHFGMPQPWDKLLLLRDETGIPILEDNAYSLFSKLNNEPFGTFGDISIFSLRKNLPLIDGGMLCINNPKYKFELSHNKSPWFYLAEMPNLLHLIGSDLRFFNFLKIIRYIASKLGFMMHPPPPLYSDKEEDYPDWPLRDFIGREFSCDYLRPMSKLARVQLNKFSQQDYIDIFNKKRQYYIWLSKEINNIKGISVLWPVLPEGIVPFSVSILIKSKRDIFLETLRKKYDIMAWPTLSKSVLDQIDNFPEIRLLGKKLLQINLPTAKVRLPDFSKYLEDLVHDIYKLSEKY